LTPFVFVSKFKRIMSHFDEKVVDKRRVYVEKAWKTSIKSRMNEWNDAYR